MANEATSALWATANALSILVQDAILEYQARYPVLANLVRTYTLGPAQGKTTGVRRWPTLSPASLTEGTDMSQTAGTPTTVQITAAVSGISFEVTKLLERSDVGVINAIGAQGGAVTMQGLEDALTALLPALNAGTFFGTSNSDMTLANFLDCAAAVLANQAAGELFAILHPQQTQDLIRSVGGSAGFAGTESAMALDKFGSTRGFKGVIGGVPVYESARCPTANSAVDRVGAIMTQDALSTVLKWNVEVETQKWVIGPSTYVAATMAYGTGETADQFGAPLITDA